MQHLQSFALEPERLPDLMAILDEVGIEAEHVDLAEARDSEGGRPVLVRYEGSDEDHGRLAARLRQEAWVRLEGE